jgi:hypothetical protein
MKSDVERVRDTVQNLGSQLSQLQLGKHISLEDSKLAPLQCLIATVFF